MAARRSSNKGKAGAPQPRKTAKKTRAKAAGTSAAAQEPRRRPTQARSQRRFDAIVEAAAASFARFGFPDTTMEGIAASAGTSIGSVYQFFPNKRAVFREVALRCLALSRSNYTELLGPNPLSQPWYVLLDRVVDGFVRQHAEHLLMQAVFRNLELYQEYAAEDEALLRELTAATGMLFASWVPDFPAEQRVAVASMLVNCVAMMIVVLSRTEDPAAADAVVRETKVMLRRYLAGYLPDSAAPPPEGL